MEPKKRYGNEGEQKEYLERFCEPFQSCSAGRDGGVWYIRCTNEREKPDVLTAIRSSGRINVSEDCGEMLIVGFYD